MTHSTIDVGDGWGIAMTLLRLGATLRRVGGKLVIDCSQWGGS